jgi:Protein of unknown function (DUF3551)
MPKIFLVLAGLLQVLLLSAGSVDAQTYPWCAQYTGENCSTNCGFSTRQQCMSTVSGIGGYCYENPQFVAQAGAPRSRKR